MLHCHVFEDDLDPMVDLYPVDMVDGKLSGFSEMEDDRNLDESVSGIVSFW